MISQLCLFGFGKQCATTCGLIGEVVAVTKNCNATGCCSLEPLLADRAQYFRIMLGYFGRLSSPVI